MIGLILFIGIIAAFIIGGKISARQYEAEMVKAQAAAYRGHISPVVVGQTYISQPVSELQDVADLWRKMLTDSGNPYAELIPIEVFPFQAALTAQGSLALSFSMYEKQLAERRLQANLEWMQKCPESVRILFATQNFASQPVSSN